MIIAHKQPGHTSTVHHDSGSAFHESLIPVITGKFLRGVDHQMVVTKKKPDTKEPVTKKTNSTKAVPKKAVAGKTVAKPVSKSKK